MTALTTQAPGVPRQSSDTFTQSNTILAGQAPTVVGRGRTFDDLAQYSLVGIVTITGAIVLSDPAAADGSQLPVGVTTTAVTIDDSNSAVNSNSIAQENGEPVAYYKDGVFNYDMLVKNGSWTLQTLQNALARTPLGVDVIKTATPGTPSAP